MHIIWLNSWKLQTCLLYHVCKMASKSSCYYTACDETGVYKAAQLHHKPDDDWRIYNIPVVLTKGKYLI
jgi:hypothetical protein